MFETYLGRAPYWGLKNFKVVRKGIKYVPGTRETPSYENMLSAIFLESGSTSELYLKRIQPGLYFFKGLIAAW